MDVEAQLLSHSQKALFLYDRAKVHSYESMGKGDLNYHSSYYFCATQGVCSILTLQ